MGLIHSRRQARAEEAEISAGNPYRYPPKSGNYFGNYFIMGGERFETNQQDTYLFGENDDLNFLGSKPIQFPYPAPQAHEPTKTLKSLVNIRRDSLKLIRDVDDPSHPKNDIIGGEICQHPTTRYNIEFTFDSDVKCAVTIYYFATEEVISKQAVYHPRDPAMNSETFHYKRGANQTFSQSLHVIDPTQFADEDWQYNIDKEVIPIVIQCVVEEEELFTHSHVTYAVIDKSCDGLFAIKCLKQKQFVDGVGYLLQEVYGIENKNTERDKLDDDIDDNGSECVICMCEMRDTLILPCRHLCLCNGCADNLRYQASNCPICRAKFCALLQIRAMRRKLPAPASTVGCGIGIAGSLSLSSAPRQIELAAEDVPLSQEGVPPGFEAVSLIEALNGPTLPHCALHASVGPTDCISAALLSPLASDITDNDEKLVRGVPQSSVPHVLDSDSDERSSCANVEASASDHAAENGIRPTCKKLAFTDFTLSDSESAADGNNLDQNNSASSPLTMASGDDSQYEVLGTNSAVYTNSEAPGTSPLSTICPRISLTASVHSSLEIVDEVGGAAGGGTDGSSSQKTAVGRSLVNDNAASSCDAARSQQSDAATEAVSLSGDRSLPRCVADRKSQSAKPRISSECDASTANATGTTSLLDVRKSVGAWSNGTDRSSYCSSSSCSNKALLSSSGETTDSDAI